MLQIPERVGYFWKKRTRTLTKKRVRISGRRSPGAKLSKFSCMGY